jgi:2-hydroxychromene-2-carboxylate isomerase
MKSVSFFHDPASPYTYLAATQIEAIAERCGARVEYKPMLIGKVFEATGNRMPAAVKAKAKYMMGDLNLWAKHYGVPISFPRIFPINTILAQRVACAVPSEHAAAWTLAIMTAYWAKGADISQPEVVQGIADSLGLNGKALLERALTQEIKDQLRSNTDEAIARGAFGAPTFFVGDTMFWGNDRLVLIEECLMSAA